MEIFQRRSKKDLVKNKERKKASFMGVPRGELKTDGAPSDYHPRDTDRRPSDGRRRECTYHDGRGVVTGEQQWYCFFFLS